MNSMTLHPVVRRVPARFHLSEREISTGISHTYLIALLIALLLMVIAPAVVHGQYFGRNKVQYEQFDFSVMKTEHFDIYFYPEEEAAVRDAARMAERWYERLSTIFQHDFSAKKPLILYANQGDFQQTNAISGMIGEGTGGVTESIKDRVILPFTGSYEENDHVLGHELVHAFQYDIANRGGSNGMQGMAQLPLWFIEGMAEYLSVGRVDPNSSMWLRDAVLRDDLPTIDDLGGNSKYFPYRYGQALWAYIGGRYGDDVVHDIYRGALSAGIEPSLRRVIGIGEDSLSALWHADLRSTYSPMLVGRTEPRALGERILAFDTDGGDLNVAPSISPDGKYVAFLSTRGLFSIDLFLADAATGEVISELFSAESDGHFDAIRFINSAGSWSPDGTRFAFVTFASGNDEISILDMATRNIDRRIRVEGIGAISNPGWSPDGTRLVFSGIAGGISDLYVVDVRTSRTERLTDDRNADIHPVWSPDGRTIAFASDRGSGTDFTRLTYSKLGISIIDVSTKAVRQLPLFQGADHINPQFSPDGRDIYFISNQDGFPDIYRYTLAGDQVHRVTKVATGISGIAASSPAMSVAAKSGRIMFSIFEGGSNSIHAMNPGTVTEELVTERVGDQLPGAILPPETAADVKMVDPYLNDAITGLPTQTDFEVVPYSAALQLDYIGTPTVGVSTSEAFGPSLGGAISAYFSDLLGNHQLGVSVQMNGLGGGLNLGDIGAEVFYLNQRNRWNWGATASHIPYVASQVFQRPVDITLDSQNVRAIEVRQDFQRVYIDGGSLLTQYPFSTTQRFEAEAGYKHYGYDVRSNYEYYVGGDIVGEKVVEGQTLEGLNLFQGTTALVGDNSHFGFTSPVEGTRYRLEAGATTGTLTFGTALADFRHYIFMKPVTFAMRGFHYGRYGKDGESDRITPLFLGYPTYVHGYESFDISECEGTNADGTCPVYDRLLGSRMAVANLEVRLPLFGNSDFGLINFPFLPTELAAFLDAGVAWTSDQAPVFKLERNSMERIPVMSAGLAARVNVLGYMVVEIFYVYPFQRPEKGAHFGFQIAPGW